MVNSWKTVLEKEIPADIREEIDGFETELILKKDGRIDDRVFMESRGRRGIYGQRYDNTLRHDGKKEYKIPFLTDISKGPNINWDASGMQRIKIPHGRLSVEQLEVLAQLAEEYGDAILHITTRQDVQIHFIHIADTPDVFRRLAAVGITSKEACGNSVRNVTGCAIAGVCRDQSFDISPYANVLTHFLLGHPDIQDFGRKFKIALSGCSDKPCALTNLHDLGFIARKRIIDGKEVRGFSMYVGGGLGAVPHEAKLLKDFVSEDEMLQYTQATCRVFARLGEKKKRNKARIKFLVANLGIEEFICLVDEELKVMPADKNWAKYIDDMRNGSYTEEVISKPGAEFNPDTSDKEYALWCKTNVYQQIQEGYSTVTAKLPLGDITSNQARNFVDVVKKYAGDTMRTTIEQNLLLRWVSNDDIKNLYEEIKKINLADAGAGTILDIVSCPGTDTCKLGVSASRGLAAILSKRLAKQLATKSFTLDKSVSDLRIKVSGCFNSCSMHHIADIGFYGVSRQQDDYVVPHFQMVLGGSMQHNGEAYGLAIASIPSKAIPEAVDRLTSYYAKERQGDESFKDFVARKGKSDLKILIEDLRKVPAYVENKSFYVDWGDVREYSTGDKSIGECSGEIISLTGMGLKNADRKVFDAQLALDKKNIGDASNLAYGSMLTAARALIKEDNIDISEDANQIMKEFEERIISTEKFLDQNANYFVTAFENQSKELTVEEAHRRVEEAQLFIEECYSFDIKRAQEKNS